MPGIVQQQMPSPPQAGPADAAASQQPAPPQQAPQDSDATTGDPIEQFSPQNVRAGMAIPPALRDAYLRVVTAGMKVMFDDQTHGQMLQVLKQPGPLEQKIGMGVAGLMILLFQQSNKTMPPQVIIPAGVELLAHAVDFLRQAGQQVPAQIVAEATSIMITTLLKKFGVDPDKLQAYAGSKGAGAQQPQPPADDESQEPPPSPPGEEQEPQPMQGA